MNRTPHRTQRLAAALARRLVRVTAVAALAACGALAAADELRERDDDDDDLASLATAVDRATARVLDAPPGDADDRALVVLVATREAVALATSPAPSPAQTAELLQTVGVVEHFASVPTSIPWEARLDPPPRA